MKPERTIMDDLIYEHLYRFGENNLFRASLDHFRETGQASGSFRSALHAMMEEYRQSSPVESRDTFAMKFLEYASGLAVSNYKSGGNWYLSDGRIVKTADILKQFKSELPIEETKEK